MPPQAPRSQTVAAVVLAYSRFEYLKELIAGLKAQSHPADEIIVIYQGSHDDIADWLATQSSITYVRKANEGSAGGFSFCIEEAYRRGHGWAWIFDDDAIPEAIALQRLIEAPYFQQENTAFLASRIVDRRGMTYMSPIPADANRWYATVLEDKCVEVVVACWLGLLVSLHAVQKCGLPIAEFFFQEEDLEFTSRLSQAGPAYCVIESVIIHFQEDSGTFDPFGKDFLKYAYSVRNRIARILIGPNRSGRLTRFLRAAKQACQYVLDIFKRKAPLRVLPWIVRGFFFRAHIRYPNAPQEIQSVE